MSSAYQLDYCEEYYQNKNQSYQNKSNKKRRRRKKRVPELVLICSLACLIVMISILYLGQQLYIMRINVEISQLEQSFHKVNREQAQLHLELNRIGSLSNIEHIARNSLGMVEPANAAIITINPGIRQEETVNGWLAKNEEEQSVFVVVAEWLNSWLPLGGVEAGRIGER